MEALEQAPRKRVLAAVFWKVVPLSCGTLLAIWLFVGIVGERLLEEKAVEGLEFAADQQTLAVADKVETLMGRLRSIAGNALAINAFVDPLSVEHFLSPFFRTLRFGDYNSLIIAMTDFSGHVVASNQVNHPLETELLEEIWHESVMKGDEVFTLVDGSLIAAVPIEVGALPEGGLMLMLSPEDTTNLLSSNKHGGQVWLRRQDGQLLFGPPPDEETSQAGDMVRSDIMDIPGFPALKLSSAVARPEQDHLFGALHGFLLVAFLVDLAALILCVYLAASLVANPLKKLVTKIQSLQQLTDPGARLETDGPYELAELANAFNQAAERQVELTKRLEQALANEKEINQMQRKFVSLVSHEFRTPLTIIDGNAQRILRKIDTMPREAMGTALGKCRASVARLTGLMESFLSSSRLEAGTIELKPGPCNLFTMLNEIIDNQRELSRSYDFIIDIEGLPREMMGDEKLLHQIFVNLLSNAVKYSPDESAIEIKGYLDDGEAVISVRDRGVGIPEDEMSKLFGRFFRASTASGIPGTGIGLHLVKNIVEIHKGTITVESVEDEGSTFLVRLPVGEAEDNQTLAA